MENILNVSQLSLDAGLLALCCAAIFRDRPAAKDILLFPLLLLFCAAAKITLTVGEQVTVYFPAQGFEMAPANNIMVLLFLLLVVLLLNSIFFDRPGNGSVFCGTMAVFSLYLLARCLGIALFALCGGTAPMLLIGSRIAAVVLMSLLLLTPFFPRLRQIILTGDFITGVVSASFAVFLMLVFSVLSFDVQRFIAHLWPSTALLLGILLSDGVLLYFNQRRMQQRKRVHMIEQYIPIVEELISQVRARQHEFNNRMLAVAAAAASAESLEEAQNTIAALTQSMAINPNDHELLACDSKIIAGMLFGKMKQAEAAAIHLEIELRAPFNKGLTPETAWLELIGILLDNAIEASPEGSTIYLKSKPQGSYLALWVSNPAPFMSNTAFMSLFRRGATTKAEQGAHGFGLYNVLRTAERYRGKIITRNEQTAEENYVVFGVLLP